MDLKDLQQPLKITDIDFRIQSINKGGYATILAYKDARVDMNRLDDVCGVLNWKREHTRDNHNCIVSIWDDEKKQWVSKEDTGTESNTEKSKGLASDSFKRACFNWGIGRELYDYPLVQIKLNSNEFKIVPASGNYKERVVQTWDLKLKEWKWISEFKDGKLIKLSCVDNNNKNRFNFSKSDPKKADEKTNDNLDELTNLSKSAGIDLSDTMQVFKKLGFEKTKEKLMDKINKQT